MLCVKHICPTNIISIVTNNKNELWKLLGWQVFKKDHIIVIHFNLLQVCWSMLSFFLSFFLSLFLCFTQFCGSFHCLFGKFFDIISKTSQQLSKVTQWFAQIFESVKISPRWHMLPFDCTANAFEPFGRCLPLLHRQILIDNDKNIDSSKQAGHNVVLIPAYWPPGGFADVDLPWICNGM